MRIAIKSVALALAVLSSALLLPSCGSKKGLLIPHSVSTASSVTIEDLNLQPGQYEILKTVSETATVTCKFDGNSMRISGDEFTYKFKFDSNSGWTLDSFSGAASLGYFSTDYTPEGGINVPHPEDFARRVAMARIINALSDYGADGIIEPVTSTVSRNVDNKTVEFVSTVRAKMVVIKTTH